MKTSGKKALSLLLALLMLISLFGGITIVGAEGGEPAVSYYQAVDDFTVGQPTMLVAEYEGSYYALTYSGGAIGAVEVTVNENMASGALDDGALWTCSETGLLESVGSPGLSLRGGSSFKVNNQGDRPGYYDAENKTYYVWNYGGTYYYPLTYDGSAFVLNGSGSTIQLYTPYLFKEAEDLEPDVPSILVAEVGEEHYALSYDGSAIVAAPVAFNADGDIYGVAPDAQPVWIMAEGGLLQSAAFPGLSLRGGSSFKVNNQGDRPGYYDAENKTYYVWNYGGTYYYPLTCDGTTFTLNGSGSTITIYSVPSLLEKYTITFDANLEGVDDLTGTKVQGEDYEITEELSKIGWIFLGWNTKADGTGTPYAVSDKITADEDLTLYAIWEENTSLPLTYFSRNDELTEDGDYVIVAQVEDEYYALIYDGGATGALKVTVDGDYATLAAENPQIAVWTLDDGNHFEAATAIGTYLYPYSGGLTYTSGRVFEYDSESDILHFATSSSNGWITYADGKFNYIQSDTAPEGAAKILLFSPADLGALANTLEEGEEYFIVGKSGDNCYAMSGNGSAAAAEVSPEGGFIAALGEGARWTYASGSLTCGNAVLSNVSYADSALRIGSSYMSFSGSAFATSDTAAEILLFKFIPAAEKYTLTFDGNAPDVETTTAIKTEGKNYKITESPDRRSFALTAWNTEADGTGTSFALGDVITDEYIGVDGTLTLYAIWAETTNSEAYVFEKADYTDKAGIGTPALFVAQAGENYFALSTDGSTVSAEAVTAAPDGTITVTGDNAVWYVAQNGYLKEKLGSERYGGYYLSFAGGLGVDAEAGIVWYEDGVLALKSDTDTVAGYLAFDGGAFSVTASKADACALDFYVQAPTFTQVSALTAGKDYIIATKSGEEYYALSYDGDLGAIPVVYDANAGTVAASSAAAWHYADDQVLESVAVPGNAIFCGSGGFMVYDSTGSYRRNFVYDSSTQKVSLHSGAYYMSFDAEGKVFGQSGSADGAATVLVFERPALYHDKSYIPDGSDIAPVQRSAVTNADGSVTLAFTSDVHHDGSDNINLQTWLEASGVGYIDAFGFCGDMGSAYASVDDYWPWTQMVMDYVSGEIEANNIGDAIYTFGNHEWFPSAGGNYAAKYEEESAQKLLRIGEGVKTDKYVIYCFGSGKGAMDQVYDYDPDDIERLEKYLSTAPTGIPIFILTHYPLHYWTDVRSVEHAPEVIDVLNAAVDAGHEITVLWGHNHSDFDDYYYIPAFPGETMVFAATKDAKTGAITPKDNGTAQIKFTYVAAGCTSDAEYTGADGGSAATMNKGLIVTIGADGKLDYTYYTMDGERMPVQEPWNEPEPWLVRYREGVEPEDGSALPVINTQYVADGEAAKPVSGPLVKGYVFEGWSTIVNGSDADFDFTAPITKNTLITAKYSEVGIEIEEATLTPDETYNGETISMTAVGLQGQFTLFDIGSIFGGGSGPFTYALWFDEGGSFSFDKPVSFTKQYFDSEYNVLGTDTVELAAGEVVNVADGVDSTYEGKNISWSEFAMTLDPIDEDTSANSILIVYKPDPGNYSNAEPDTPISKFPGAITGLPDEFTVTFDPNGQDLPTYTDTKFDGYDYKITLTLYADGVEHLKWNTEADGSGTDFSVGDYYTDNEELTLYAVWEVLPEPEPEPDPGDDDVWNDAPSSGSGTTTEPAADAGLEVEITEQYKEQDIEVEVTENKDGSYTIDVTADGKPVEIKDGVKVTVPVETKPGQVLVVVDEDGNETVLKKSVTEDGEITALLDGGATIKVVENAKEFDDVAEDDWFAEAVDFVTSHEIFQGMGDGEFGPQDTMTRAMMATVLFRLEGEPAVSGGKTFADVESGKWYTAAVNWASETGIMNGYGESFGTNDAVTREQMAVLLYNYVKSLGIETEAGSTAGFSDAGELHSWGEEAMAWAVGAGIFQGDGTGRLNPGGNATRAEVATLMMRIVQFIVK